MSTVRPGADRAEVEYIWPRSIDRPAPPTQTIYLDLNHWIGLAKAAVGHPDGERHQEALEIIRGSKPEFLFPLSSVHYMEMAGIRDPRQRFDVAAVMEEISGFVCTMSGLTVMELELDAAVSAAAGRREHFDSTPFLGTGVLQAFGRKGGLRIYSDEGDITEQTRRTWSGGPSQFDAWSGNADRELSRAVLRGPTDDEAPGLRAEGWDPTAARRIASERVKFEVELARQLDDETRWRRGRLRDVVAARYLAHDAVDLLNHACEAHGVRLTDIARGGVDSARRFTDAMPSADVRITLLTAAHRNAQTQWRSNEIFDIDALSVAVPYCGVVVTERHACHVLDSAGVPDRVGTVVLTSLEDFAEWIRSRGCDPSP